jgi:putative membrane-bound dehydrogenase-like protein
VTTKKEEASVLARSRWLALLPFLVHAPILGAAPPTVADKRLVIELVAREPEIVTPTGLAVDERGRIWVIENHTHERPPGYKGPTSDRVRVFDDFGPDGRARKVHTFAEGFKNAMSLALAPDGTVYLATRSDVYRLRDRAGKGVADERTVIVKLDSPGDYPHNGLSGFAFDGVGNLYFSLGENLGAPYKLIGSDGITFKGGGEGGSIYRCRPDGKSLARIATGFWNTFHLAFDADGRLWAVDNDPDSRGPCRLLHIVQGGDYGYRFRNGRKGLHPFTAWNGELPGTLPMASGTAEAPSGIVAYESTGLPKEYRGQLLVTSWGDHVVERFTATPRGASFTAQSKVLVRGGEDFRPVGIAVGPDGALYLSDWVDKSYPVHGKGRIWRIRMKEPPKDDGLRVSQVAKWDVGKLRLLLGHPKREIRDAAGAALARKGKDAKAVLANVLKDRTDERSRMQALWAVARLDTDTATELLTAALGNPLSEVRGEAAALLGNLLSADPGKRQEEPLLQLAKDDPSAFVRMQATLPLRTPAALKAMVPRLADPDPYLAAAALEVLGRPGQASLLLPYLDKADAKLRLGLLLALRRSGAAEGRAQLPKFLADADPEVRRAAIQWVGEERLREHAGSLKASASKAPVTRELFEALLASNAFLSGAKPGPKEETRAEEYVAKVMQDATEPAAFRTLALRMLRPDQPALTVDRLRQFLTDKDEGLRREAARTLIHRGDEKSQALLRGLVGDAKAQPDLRGQAVVGLAHSAPSAPATRRLLLSLLAEPGLRRDALRSLRGAAHQPDVERPLLAWWDKYAAAKDAAPEERRELAGQMLLALGNGKGPKTDAQFKALAELAGPRPKMEAEWRKVLAQGGDPAAGERVFFHVRGPRCAVCHRIDGRGGQIGPDLSTVGRALSRDKLIESILTPSKEIAPQFVSWRITTRDGKTRIGVLVEEGPNSTITLADAEGKLTVIKRLDVEDREALPTSLMPDNLHELMTPREFRDLLAFLEERK